MFDWLRNNVADERLDALISELRSKLDHANRCPVRYSHTNICTCHVERTAQIVEEWGRK